MLSLEELRGLAAHVGDGPSERATHGEDLTYHPPHQPDAVVYPESTDEVARVLAYANEHGSPSSRSAPARASRAT